MRITGVHIQNFKRFTDLSIEGIPSTAKLILLIGGNGSGKSSVFDGFDYVSKQFKDASIEKDRYYNKGSEKGLKINLNFSSGEIMNCEYDKEEGIINGTGLPNDIKFIGRSSMRIVPRIDFSRLNFERDILLNDKDAPLSFIDFDTRFNFDVTKYIKDVTDAVREPVFRGENADTVKIFSQFIEPINKALKNIFGESETTVIEIAKFKDADLYGPPNLIFKKGISEIEYDVLSHGEKQVVITLLNFIVRKKQLENSIYFIDEMDAHLNTAIQYTLLKEITENWIPETCQLWTASHSLGFIDYARQADHATIIDFDQLNFDLPQVLTPEPKDNLEVYEIAVGKDILSRIFEGMNIFFVENKDDQYFNNLGLKHTIFVPEKDKNSVYHKTRTSEFKGVIDRDFLTDEEVLELEKDYPNMKILRYYSLENYLFHPKNLKEYYAKNNQPFSIKDYTQQLLIAKNAIKDRLILNLKATRMSYPFYKEAGQEKNKNKKWFTNHSENTESSASIVQLLNSKKLEDFYKVLPIKNHATQIPQRQNIQFSDLTKTEWFKEQIEKIIS